MGIFYFGSICSVDVRELGFSVILDARNTTWANTKVILRTLQVSHVTSHVHACHMSMHVGGVAWADPYRVYHSAWAVLAEATEQSWPQQREGQAGVLSEGGWGRGEGWGVIPNHMTSLHIHAHRLSSSLQWRS